MVPSSFYLENTLNKNAITLAVDVDLTVVDTHTPWIKEFEEKTGVVPKNLCSSYDFIPEMTEILESKGMTYGDYNPYRFWKQPNLYDDLKTIPYCVEVLKELSKEMNIIFVSDCEPEHIESKKDFLFSNFNFDYGFVDTADKYLVDYDILIDDKLDNILDGMAYRNRADHVLFTHVREDGHKNKRFKDVEKIDCWLKFRQWLKDYRYVQ